MESYQRHVLVFDLKHWYDETTLGLTSTCACDSYCSLARTCFVDPLLIGGGEHSFFIHVLLCVFHYLYSRTLGGPAPYIPPMDIHA